jgi:SAM-dependent methyltransferase/uncharacterized protein with ATP-grasp and redox domains
VVEDKRSNHTLLLLNDGTYPKWIEDMVNDQINKTNFSTQEKEQILRDVKSNIEILLNFRVNEKYIADTTFNQEFVDIIRRVTAYTIYGDTEKILYTAEIFNQLADRLMPHIIQKVIDNKTDFKTLFLLSVASGISGLDLKGAPAAASPYANTGIAMKQYLNMDDFAAATDYFDKLFEVVASSKTPVFAWNDFLLDIRQGHKLVWMTDDYIESHFDLLLIAKILEENEHICVEIIPKNGVYGNDLSALQLENLLNSLFPEKLKPHLNSGRLSVNHFGPRMGAANIRKLSNEHTQSLRLADIIVLKGCRIHEMLQGSLNLNSYSAFIVSRTFSEITTGLNSKEIPIVLIHLKPNEYAFWGMSPKNAKTSQLSDGRNITLCASTLSDHERRKVLSVPNEIIAELLSLNKLALNYFGDPRPLYQEMELLAEKLVNITKETYDKICLRYQEVRHDYKNLHEVDQRMWDNLENYIARYLKKSPKDIKMLDVATGSGRDIIYALSKGYEVVGVDNSDGFINILEKLLEEKRIPEGSFAKNDMRSLQFADCSFDVVRHNASLLHLPMFAKGYMADKAVCEAYRVLKQGGLLHVSVKQGDSLQFVDTDEGLGGRVFQFYTHETINELLQRNGFTIIYTTDELKFMPSGNVVWIAVIAQKL